MQAYLYGDIGDDIVIIRPPDWWPEQVQEGHVVLVLKSIYDKLQAARKWQKSISAWTWRENNGYKAAIFMKHKGAEFI